VGRNITDRLRVEEQLRQAQKMEAIGSLSGGIAHDFNDILMIIMGNIDLVLDELSPSASSRENLEQAQTACVRAKEMINQILTFSRKSSLNKEPINVSSLVKDSLKLLRAAIPTTIKIKQDIEDIPETLLANPTQINQILLNLCSNASYAMGYEGSLVIKLQKITLEEDADAIVANKLAPGNYVLLSVRDNGCGMEPEVMERIFDPYYTTKDVGKGSGLGLSVVYGIVKAHQGTITVDSEPGRGTTFNVHLPLVACPPSNKLPRQ
jgi:signal transduction histidine kinase